MGVLFDPDPKWYVESEEAVGRALELDPTNAEAWVNSRPNPVVNPPRLLGTTKLCGTSEKTHHLPSRPHDAPLWEGLVLLHVGLHDEARSCLLEALEEQPDDLMAVIGLGEIASYDGDHATALEHYERTLALEPSHVYGNMFVTVGLLYLDESG